MTKNDLRSIIEHGLPGMPYLIADTSMGYSEVIVPEMDVARTVDCIEAHAALGVARSASTPGILSANLGIHIRPYVPPAKEQAHG